MVENESEALYMLLLSYNYRPMMVKKFATSESNTTYNVPPGW